MGPRGTREVVLVATRRCRTDASRVLARWPPGRGSGGPSRARSLSLSHVRRRDRDLPRSHLPWCRRATPVRRKRFLGHVGTGSGWLPLEFESPTDVPEETVFSD